MIDQVLPLAAVGTITGVVGFIAGLVVGREEVRSLHLQIADLLSEIRDLRAQNQEFAKAEFDRQAQRLAASRRAAELAAERRKQNEKEAPARRERTIAALQNTKLRSRAQVVASVKAKRTRKKKSAGGVAPITAG